MLAPALAVAVPPQAQTYPNRPVQLIVPFAPRGFTDAAARILRHELSQSLGQQFFVENKPGAGSTIGTDFVAKSPPDGYTLLMVSSTHVISPGPDKSCPTTRSRASPSCASWSIAVRAGGAIRRCRRATCSELIAPAKAKPGIDRLRVLGQRQRQHLVGGLFVAMTGAPLKHVPYAAAGAAEDLVAGVVESSFAGVPNALAQVPTGRLRGAGRHHGESAFRNSRTCRRCRRPALPAMSASVWLALLAPAGTPAEIVGILNSEVARLMDSPDTRKSLFDAGVEGTPSTPEAMSQYMVQEMARWGKLVQDAGIKLE